MAIMTWPCSPSSPLTTPLYAHLSSTMVDFLLFLTYSEIMGLWAFSHTFPSAKKALSLQLLIAVPRHSDLCTDITSSEKDVPKRFLYPPSLTLLNFLHNIYYYRNYLYFFPCLLPLLEWKFHKHVDFEYFTAVFSNTTGLKQSFIHSKHSISIS